MSTHMIRKQIYLHKRQEAILRRLSQERGVSEAELIRQAIEREASSISAQVVLPDRSAWQELVDFLEARQKTVTGGLSYNWNRGEIYTDRESRWLHDKDQD